MPGYDAWKADDRNYERCDPQGGSYDDEAPEPEPRPLRYRLAWFYDWALNRIVARFEVLGSRGWFTLSESWGETLSSAVHNLRAQRHAAHADYRMWLAAGGKP